MDWTQTLTILGFMGATIAWAVMRLDKKFDKIDQRFDKIDQRFEKIELRLSRIENRLDVLEQSLRSLEHRLERVENRLERVEIKYQEWTERLIRIEIYIGSYYVPLLKEKEASTSKVPTL